MSVYDPYSAGGEDGLVSKKPAKASAAWMLTVADLFSLMLTFFVLLYSMSVIQKDKWDAISLSLMQRLQVVVDEEVPATTPSDFSILRADFTYARGLDYLKTVIERHFTAENGLDGILINHGDDRITLSLTSDTMFDKGSASMTPEAQATMRRLGLFLSAIGNRITIEGHTDPVPITTTAFPSNWELSMARGISVAHMLRQAGYPYTIDVFGLGSSRYGDLENLPPDQRDKLARRVDIIVRETVAKR